MNDQTLPPKSGWYSVREKGFGWRDSEIVFVMTPQFAANSIYCEDYESNNNKLVLRVGSNEAWDYTRFEFGTRLNISRKKRSRYVTEYNREEI